MSIDKTMGYRTPKHSLTRYAGPGQKQVTLFYYLAGIMWGLSCRIPWGQLREEEYRKIRAVQPKLTRIAAKARAARLMEDTRDLQ